MQNFITYQSRNTRQARVSQHNSIKQFICTTALCLADEAVRKGQQSFLYMGKLFDLTAISEREYYVTCDGRDAGIRVYDGIAVLS